VAELPSGTVTFLFTDIEGSTRLLHELGPDGYADALAGHRRVLREPLARRRASPSSSDSATSAAWPSVATSGREARGWRDPQTRSCCSSSAKRRARRSARESLRLARELVDRQSIVYSIALLARLATAAGHVERAGCLWGAVERETARGPGGHWENDRDGFAQHIVCDDPEFERGREAGSKLSLDAAVEYALGP